MGLNIGWRFLFCLSLTLKALAATVEWQPVTVQERELQHSAIDPDAGSEILFKDVRIDKKTTSTYIRCKIFNERGRERFANVTIEYFGRTRIRSVAGRTIHQDGKVFDVEASDIHDTVEIKAKGVQAKVLTFALPAVEPGSVIEYQWTEDWSESHAFLEVQSDVPTVQATFHLSTAEHANLGGDLHYLAFACKPESSSAERGFVTLSLRNVPAYREEAFSPPNLSSRKWILAYYESLPPMATGNYWGFWASALFTDVEERTKVNGAMKRQVAEIAVGQNDEEKLLALATYCRQNITNISDEDATLEERDEFKRNKTAADTLRRGSGTARDMHLAFIALAKAAGYDARLAVVAGRREFFFTPLDEVRGLMRNFDAAVLVNGRWKFYDVSNRTVPLGTLSWDEQGVNALIPALQVPIWVETPTLTAGESRIERVADMTLSVEGDLGGTVREYYWGNKGMDWRKDHGSQTEGERQEFIRKQLKERFTDFEVSELHIQMSPDPKLPIGVSYRLLIRKYGQRTGKRLLFGPNLFTVGGQPYFTATERINRVYFHYPWSEEDRVAVQLPDGWSLDHAQAPASFTFGNGGKYAVTEVIEKKTNLLKHSRTFVFGTDKPPLFEPKAYSVLKDVFDRVYANDEQLLALIDEKVATVAQK